MIYVYTLKIKPHLKVVLSTLSAVVTCFPSVFCITEAVDHTESIPLGITQLRFPASTEYHLCNTEDPRLSSASSPPKNSRERFMPTLECACLFKPPFGGSKSWWIWSHLLVIPFWMYLNFVWPFLLLWSLAKQPFVFYFLASLMVCALYAAWLSGWLTVVSWVWYSTRTPVSWFY